jgi:hypothetical protein
VSCDDVAALLALVGLAAELAAVFLILGSVGVFDPAGRWLQSAGTRLRTWARRLWPWSKSGEPQYIDLKPVTEVSRALRLRWGYKRDEAEDPPRTFDEVGERLNRIAADLNYLAGTTSPPRSASGRRPSGKTSARTSPPPEGRQRRSTSGSTNESRRRSEGGSQSGRPRAAYLPEASCFN